MSFSIALSLVALGWSLTNWKLVASVRLAGQGAPRSPQSLPPNAGERGMITHAKLYNIGVGDSDSASHVCIAGDLTH